MDKNPLVVAFDLATATGVCLGRAGDKPKVVTWDMRAAGPSRPRRLLCFSNLCDELFRHNRIDYLRYEAPVPLAAFSRAKADGRIAVGENTLLLLRGLIGVLECCGARADILDIQPFSVQDARQHLTGWRTFPRNKNGKSNAKAEVMRMVRMLGVDCRDDNQADAYCGWSYCCALLNPRLAQIIPRRIG